MNNPDRSAQQDAKASPGVGGGKVVLVLVVACGLFAAAIYGIIKTARPRLAPAVPIVSAGSPAAVGTPQPNSSSAGAPPAASNSAPAPTPAPAATPAPEP